MLFSVTYMLEIYCYCREKKLLIVDGRQKEIYV